MLFNRWLACVASSSPPRRARRRPLATLHSLLLGAALASGVACAAEAPKPAQETWHPLHEFLRAQTDAGGYPGAVSLIAVNGRVIDEQSYGHADLKRARAMRQDSIFRIYSMTKPITSVAALMLVEAGTLDLDAPVSRYLPAFVDLRCLCGEGGQSVPAKIPTVRHLFTHTAGFATHGDNVPASKAFEAAAPEQAHDLAGYAERVARAPLAEQPGTHFHYDGVNTQVLARIVEVVSGQSLHAFFQARILGPLGMKDTGFEVPVDQRVRVVDLVTSRGGRLAIADTASAREPGARLNDYDNGAGGLYSTLGDYFRFAQMLANGGELDGVQLLSADTVARMMRDQLATLEPAVIGPTAGEGFGLGGYVVIDPVKRGRPGSVGAFGWSGSASTYFIIDREKKLVAILMAQYLPSDDAPQLPRLSTPFYQHVYEAVSP